LHVTAFPKGVSRDFYHRECFRAKARLPIYSLRSKRAPSTTTTFFASPLSVPDDLNLCQTLPSHPRQFPNSSSGCSFFVTLKVSFSFLIVDPSPLYFLPLFPNILKYANLLKLGHRCHLFTSCFLPPPTIPDTSPGWTVPTPACLSLRLPPFSRRSKLLTLSLFVQSPPKQFGDIFVFSFRRLKVRNLPCLSLPPVFNREDRLSVVHPPVSYLSNKGMAFEPPLPPFSEV